MKRSRRNDGADALRRVRAYTSRVYGEPTRAVTDLEQHQFYEDLVRELRSRGVIAAITSGLATLAELLETHTCPPEMAARRPALQLAVNGDPQTALRGTSKTQKRRWPIRGCCQRTH